MIGWSAPRTADALREAAAWRLALAEAGLETSPAFECWLARGAAQQAAWRKVSTAWVELGAAAETPVVLSLRARALRRIGARPARHPGRRPGVGKWLPPVAGLVLASLLVGILANGALSRAETFGTRRGERRTVVLTDGSRVTLDADTVVQVRLAPATREIVLSHGQARFDVAHDPRRPFRVHAAGQTITALGTVFTVDRTRDELQVTLIAGRVSVARDRTGAASSGTILHPGQRLAISGARHASMQTVAPDRATAWEAGRLVFDNEPLGVVVDRVSRYGVRPIVVPDAAVAQLKVSGAFSAGDSAGFLEAVTQYLNLEAVPTTSGTIELRRVSEK